jgi:hypothetical protein
MQGHHTTYAERGTLALVRPLTHCSEYRVIRTFIGFTFADTRDSKSRLLSSDEPHYRY